MTARILPADGSGPTLAIHAVAAADLSALLDSLPPAAATFARASGFEAAAGSHLVVPEASGGIGAVLFGLGKAGEAASPFLIGKLSTLLPAGDYRFASGVADETLAALAWALGAYRFRRYKRGGEGGDAPAARLKLGPSVDRARLESQIAAITGVRDLVNTPANDLGPAELTAAAAEMAGSAGAAFRVVAGDELAAGFPLIQAVGQGSDRAPRLIDFAWGDPDHPKVTLVGKGVCFDTGGLDIKPDTNMLLMKKDMGGAANVLGLARMIVDARLPVRLRVLIPAVENAISGRAFRPSDVFASRKGLTVEIGNTDAEGRLVLADALALADEEAPDLIVDMATLTGAARVALGPDVPPFYTDDDGFAAELAAASAAVHDPLWRLPLWMPYAPMLESKIADTNNIGSGGFAGSIIAALFLKKFVERARTWVHLDIYAWNPSPKPGRPDGGEAQGIRALFAAIEKRYAGA
ncbi:leucyl aminopeptidase family protein [Prosthecodimorpha staleyi]|uniref:leucyl aminopeptidase family protein n=1 Tax=Prosthecodimorpha staleyi TaxID=2840188 RepID=UPI0036F1B54C